MAMIAHGNVARNKKANFNYNIIEKFEAGIVLRGVEVKSLRCGTSSISEAYVVERNNELWLQNCYIPEYQGGVLSRFDTRRDRKLLLHKKQIAKILGEMSKSGMSVVPLDVFFNNRGLAKVTIGLGVGKKNHDKRQTIANRDWARQKNRIMKSGQYD